jgi:hypothetical protein
MFSRANRVFLAATAGAATGSGVGATGKAKGMVHRFVVKVAAGLEVVVGIIFLTAPDIPCRLLFAATPEGLGILLGRFAGIALVALGITCLISAAPGPLRSGALGLLVFNVGATFFFAWVAVATAFRGSLLWPVVVLHAILAAALLPQFLTMRSFASKTPRFKVSE